LLVIGWGILLTCFAIFLDRMRGDINVVNLAFGMVSYTAGPLLGMFLAAIVPWRHASLRGLTIGFIISFITVLYFRADLYTVLINFKIVTPQLAASFHGVRLNLDGNIEPWLNHAWLWPVTTMITLFCGLIFGSKKVAKL
jgi:MFS family permease